MHNLKDLRKNLETLKQQFEHRNTKFDPMDFIKKDNYNRDLISKKEKLEHEKKVIIKNKRQG